MRVGIHSGQVFCGVLGKKRWQFDIHSHDVKVANEAEQKGQPGRVHITQSTRLALGGRYELEPKGDKHFEHPGATFFVKPPEIRRQRLLEAARKFNCDNLAANSSQTTVLMTTTTASASMERDGNSASISMMLTAAGETTTGPSSINGSGGALVAISEPLAESNRVLGAVASPTTAAATTTTTATIRPDAVFNGGAATLQLVVGAAPGEQLQAHQQQQQPQQQTGAARVRFRSAGKRLITMLYLIDPPFSNLAPPTQVKTSRLLLQTIQEQQADIDPIWLSFENKEIGELYKNEPQRPRAALELAQRLVIFFVGLISLVVLVYVSQPTVNSSSSSSFSSQPTLVAEKIRMRDDAAADANMTTTATTTTTMKTTTTTTSVIELLDTLESLALIGEIMFAFLLSVLVYVHQTEYSRRRDFFWRQKAKRDKERVALIRSCNRQIFLNMLPSHVANYFLERRPQLSTSSSNHMVSSESNCVPLCELANKLCSEIDSQQNRPSPATSDHTARFPLGGRLQRRRPRR